MVALASTPMDNTKLILSSNEPVSIANKIFHKESVVNGLEKSISLHGKITNFTCFTSHDSKLFDSIACHIAFENLKNGSVWEFLYFLDEKRWVGTNILFVKEVSKNGCISNISKGKGLGTGVNVQLSECQGIQNKPIKALDKN